MRLLACGNFAAQSGEKTMALQLYDQVTIAGHFLPALIYGDTSGLSVPDCKRLIHWAVENPKLAAGVFDVPSESHFATDTITGLAADCYDVDIYVDDNSKGGE
jgi:hypothetical protein